jgi:serine protease Do
MSRLWMKNFLAIGLLAAIVGCRAQNDHSATASMSAAPSTQPHDVKASLPGSTATVPPAVAQALYERVKPSLVAVQYTFSGELGRQDVIGPGVVVSSDGLVMTSMAMFPLQMPNEQMVDFKVLVPGDEETELDATFEGRDERSAVAFVRTKEKQNWPAIEFTEAPQQIGEAVLSVGLLPKFAGYHAYITQSTVSANLRGPVPQTLVSADGLAMMGSPVFDARGRAIGMVNHLSDQAIVLNDQRTPMGATTTPPRMYVPTRDFQQSLQDPPSAEHPLALPWLGVSQLTGLNKEVAEFLHLKGQPAVQIGAVIPGFAAEKAGLKAGDIIVRFNGEPLERGDEPEEAALILLRKVRRLKVGTQISFSVLKPNGNGGAAGTKLTELKMTLEERPKQANEAKRFYADDLGFTAREMVFEDKYDRRLKPDFKGVLIALVKPSSSAQSGQLKVNDIVTQINRTPVEDLDQFKKLYEDFRKKNKKEAVVLEVLRGVNTEVIRIEPPQ